MQICARCKAEVSDDKAIYIRTARNQVLPLCAACSAEMDRLLAAEEANPKLWLGTGLGALAAGLGVAGWLYASRITHQQLGIATLILGWLVGQAVMLGSGRKRGSRVQLLAAVITFLALAVAEALQAQFFFPPADTSLASLFNSVASHVAANWTMVLFWIIGLFEAWFITAPRRLNKVPAPKQ